MVDYIWNISFYPCILRPLWASSEYCHFGLLPRGIAIALTVTESPYRVTAEQISSTCGQSISAGGVWNMMQRLGERIDEEEVHAVKQMDADQTEGEKDGIKKSI